MAHKDGYTTRMGIVVDYGDPNNGITLPDPSEITWGLSDISQSEAGRDESGTMHPMKLRDGQGNIVQKYQYQMGWNMCTPQEAAIVLQAINNAETFYVRMPDPLESTGMIPCRKLYYVGDRSAPFQQWFDGHDGHLYQKVSFTIIEV